MIADSHCHAWPVWPYGADVPDSATRGSVEHLLLEQEACGVERALIVCAEIGLPGAAIPDDGAYVRAAHERHPDRFDYVVDVDSEWSPDHHRPGAADRAAAALRAHPAAVGLTHYLRADDDGWLRTAGAREFIDVLRPGGLIASVSAPPSRIDDVAALAASAPEVTVLLHHVGWISVDGAGTITGLEALIAAADVPNVHVKLSGLHYVTGRPWAFPYSEAARAVEEVARAFGPRRMLWGSDFPASLGKQTYRQSLELPRLLLPGLDEVQLADVMGGNLIRLVDGIRAGADARRSCQSGEGA